jgi:malate/lactate dehydrogenase
VADLTDGAFLADTKVRVGTPQEAGQCDVIVITAGAKQRPNETRLQLIDRNFNSKIIFLIIVISILIFDDLFLITL